MRDFPQRRLSIERTVRPLLSLSKFLGRLLSLVMLVYIFMPVSYADAGIDISKSSVSATVGENLKAPSESVIIKNTGEDVVSITVSKPSGKDWLGVNSGCGSLSAGSSCSVSISMTGVGKTTGTYSGSIKVKATYENSSSTQDILATLIVVPLNIEVSPSSFTYTVGEGLRSEWKSFKITNNGPGYGYAWISISNNKSWISDGKSGCNLYVGKSCEVSVRVNSKGTEVDGTGTYTGKIGIKSGSAKKTVSVTMNVVPLNIGVSQGSLSYAVGEGLKSEFKKFKITNNGPGYGYAGISISNNKSWISDGKSSCYLYVGQSCEVSTRVAASISPEVDGVGVYSGKIGVYSGSAKKIISVTMNVVPVDIGVSPGSVSMALTPGCGRLSKTLTVKNNGPGHGSLGFLLSDNKSWILRARSSCYLNVGGSCDVSISPPSKSPSGVYTGNISVTTGSSSKRIIPVTMSVNQSPAFDPAGSFAEGSCSEYKGDVMITPSTECGATYSVLVGTTPDNLIEVESGETVGAEPVNVSEFLEELDTTTDYYYQVVAVNDVGTTESEVVKISSEDFQNECRDDDSDSDPDSEPCAELNWYKDYDNDGYGDGSAEAQVACERPDGYKLLEELNSGGDIDTDCNDDDNTFSPDAEEVCSDTIDNNCNDEVNEGCCEGYVKPSSMSVWPLISSYQYAGADKYAEMTISVGLKEPAPKDGCTMTFSVEPVQKTGGHLHEGSRPKGTVTPDKVVFSEGSKEEQEVKYKSSEVSGSDKVKVVLQEAGVSLDFEMDIKVSSLVSLGGGDYKLKKMGSDYGHEDMYSAQSWVKSAFGRIAAAYHKKFPKASLLVVTDASLPQGGLYDYKKTWKPPHKTHRIGTDIDVRSWNIKGKKNREEFEWYACKNGGFPMLEAPGKTNEHYHIFFAPYSSRAAKYCKDKEVVK